MRFFGIYDITKYLNRFAYFISEKNEKNPVDKTITTFNAKIAVPTQEERWKTLMDLAGISCSSMHSATIQMLKMIGNWYGYKVVTG